MLDEKDSLNEDESEISPTEKAILDGAFETNSYSLDETQLTHAALDNTDNDGELLNEKTSADDFSGDDLDVPGAETDDNDEAIGREDEENNQYSQADTD